ncbi:unnamed protein product [Clavelina lepadiformis]|uniref:EGF-like domain-containing protein n=1 Tax=Clavelina lepadiformis TaxID=159417 RepID=A0ABP0FXU3_CLALP
MIGHITSYVIVLLFFEFFLLAVVRCEKPEPISRHRIPANVKTFENDPLLAADWFLCRRGDRIEACRRNAQLHREESSDLKMLAADPSSSFHPRSHKSSCPKRGCLHGLCQDGACFCDVGWRGKRCQKDINECKKRPCSQKCRNTKGSYFCQCRKKYTLQADRRTCLRKAPPTNSTAIRYLPPNIESHQPTPTGLSDSHPGQTNHEILDVKKFSSRLRFRSASPRRKLPRSHKPVFNSSLTLTDLLNEVEVKARSAVEAGKRLLARVLFIRNHPQHGSSKSRNPCARMRCQFKCVKTLKSRAKCVCPPGLKLDKTRRKCVDRDECFSKRGSPCPENSECFNTIGSYTCECSVGYQPVASANSTEAGCQDVDECETGEHICSENGSCINMPGYHRCECLEGFRGDGVSCRPSNSTRQVSARRPQQGRLEEASGPDRPLLVTRLRKVRKPRRKSGNKLLSAQTPKPVTKRFVAPRTRGSRHWRRLLAMVKKHRRYRG